MNLRKESWSTVVAFEGIDNCLHSYVASEPIQANDDTVYTFICRHCLREETRARHFVFETVEDEFTKLKAKPKSEGKKNEPAASEINK